MIISRVSRLLGERRESVADLARATGLEYKAAWSLYHGQTRRIEIRTLDLLCEHFGVAPCELLEYVPSGASAAVRHAGDVAS